MYEYIERKEIRMAYEKLTRSYVNGNPYIEDWRFDEMIEELPAADVTPVLHGRWVQVIVHVECEDGFIDRLEEYCSACHKPNEGRCTYFCPNCGAKMQEQNNEKYQ